MNVCVFVRTLTLPNAHHVCSAVSGAVVSAAGVPGGVGERRPTGLLQVPRGWLLAAAGGAVVAGRPSPQGQRAAGEY